MSGILNALLAVGLIQLWKETRQLVILLVGIGAGVRIIFELGAGDSLPTDTAWLSIPSVHAAGFTVDLAFGCLPPRLQGGSLPHSSAATESA